MRREEEDREQHSAFDHVYRLVKNVGARDHGVMRIVDGSVSRRDSGYHYKDDANRTDHSLAEPGYGRILTEHAAEY
ncbi:MAG: hypothetical protein WA578_18595, partial [Candidatus Sulfotelmatobacter sp.]